MDISTFKKKIPEYNSISDALTDLRLIWKNCREYNVEGSEISETALQLGKECETLIEVMLKVYNSNIGDSFIL